MRASRGSRGEVQQAVKWQLVQAKAGVGTYHPGDLLLSSRVFLAQLFHLDLARDTEALGLLGKITTRKTTVSHIILATATQSSGSMILIPWKRGKPNKLEQPAGRWMMWCTALHLRGHSEECVSGRRLLKLTLKKSVKLHVGSSCGKFTVFQLELCSCCAELPNLSLERNFQLRRNI